MSAPDAYDSGGRGRPIADVHSPGSTSAATGAGTGRNTAIPCASSLPSPTSSVAPGRKTRALVHNLQFRQKSEGNAQATTEEILEWDNTRWLGMDITPIYSDSASSKKRSIYEILADDVKVVEDKMTRELDEIQKRPASAGDERPIKRRLATSQGKRSSEASRLGESYHYERTGRPDADLEDGETQDTETGGNGFENGRHAPRDHGC